MDIAEYLDVLTPTNRAWFERLPSDILRWHHLYFWQRVALSSECIGHGDSPNLAGLANLPLIPITRVINDVYLFEPGRRFAHGAGNGPFTRFQLIP